MNINPPDAPDDEEPIPYDEKPISKLDLDVRAERNLKDAGYDTFGDLDGVDKSTLEDVSWVGEKTAQSILDTLDAFRE